MKRMGVSMALASFHAGLVIFVGSSRTKLRSSPVRGVFCDSFPMWEARKQCLFWSASVANGRPWQKVAFVSVLLDMLVRSWSFPGAFCLSRHFRRSNGVVSGAFPRFLNQNILRKISPLHAAVMVTELPAAFFGALNLFVLVRE